MTVSFPSPRQAELRHLFGLPDPGPYPASARDEAMPSWLTPNFSQGEHSEARLARWVRAGSPIVDPEDIHITGDAGLVAAARRVLAGLPPPLQHHLHLHARFHVLGRLAAGHHLVRGAPVMGAQEREADLVAIWRRPEPRCPLRRWRLTHRLLRRLGYHWLPPAADPMREFEGRLVHECCHSWLERIYPVNLEPVSVEAAQAARENYDLQLRLAHEWNLLDKMWEDPERAERWASRLTRELGYPDHVGADCRFQQAAARSRVAAAAAEVAAKAGPLGGDAS